MTVGIPDWAISVPSTPGVHPSNTAATQFVPPFTPQQLIQIGIDMVEQFLQKVVLAVVGAFIPGISSFDQLRDWADTIPGLAQILAIADAIRAAVQQVIDGLVNALTGGLGLGADPASIFWAIVTRVVALPGQLFEQLFGGLAALQSQVTALQNNPGASLADDFKLVGVTGWTNITGTLAISPRGRYIQTSSLAVGYRNTGPATDRHGAQIIVTAKMQGVVRLGICSDTAAANYAAVELYSGFDGDAVRIVTGSSPTVTVIQEQLDFPSPKLQDSTTWDIWYDPTANTFYVLRNGQTALSWTDAGNVVTHGSTKRRVILVSNGLDEATDGMWGFGIEKGTAYDR